MCRLCFVCNAVLQTAPVAKPQAGAQPPAGGGGGSKDPNDPIVKLQTGKVRAIGLLHLNQVLNLNEFFLFVFAQIPKEWKEVLQKAGVKKKDLKNEETAKLMYSVI